MRMEYILSMMLILSLTSVVQAAEPQILSNSSYIDPSNYFTVVGEIQNNLDQNIQFVEIIATFYNSNDTVIGTDYAFTDVSILKPGQKSPFEISSYPDKIIPARYKLTLSYSTTTLEPFSGLKILSNSSKIDSSGYYKIVGEIKNNGLNSSSDVKVVATYYNPSNIVIGKAYTFTTPSTIQIDDTASFEISSYPLKIVPSKYELQVEGTGLSAPIPIPTPWPADMNCNGIIDTGDATLVLRSIVGLEIPKCWE